MTKKDVNKKNLTEKFLCWYYGSFLYEWKIGLKYGLFSQISTSRFFLSLAWAALFDNMAVMTTGAMLSNGGYRYMNILVSKLPVSAKHRYEKWIDEDD